MGVFDSVFGPLADTLISTLGGTAYLIRQNGAYDPRSGQDVQQGAQQWTIRITPPKSFNRREAFSVAQTHGSSTGGSVVAQAGFKTTVAAEALTRNQVPVPTMGMFLKLSDGKQYRITEVNSIYSGDSVATYEITCAK